MFYSESFGIFLLLTVKVRQTYSTSIINSLLIFIGNNTDRSPVNQTTSSSSSAEVCQSSNDERWLASLIPFSTRLCQSDASFKDNSDALSVMPSWCIKHRHCDLNSSLKEEKNEDLCLTTGRDRLSNCDAEYVRKVFSTSINGLTKPYTGSDGIFIPSLMHCHELEERLKVRI